jgi:MscS family membrane protein
MKRNWRIYFRCYLALLVACLFWCCWSSAQETNQVSPTIPGSKLIRADGKSVLEIPVEELRATLSFGLDKIPALKEKLWGKPRWLYLASLIYVVLAFYVSKLIDFVIRRVLKQWASRTTTTLDDLLLDLVHGPIKIVAFAIFLHIGLNVFSWDPWVEEATSKIVILIVACSITYMAWRSVDILMNYWISRGVAGEERAYDKQLFPIISKSLKVFVIVVAVLVTGDHLGIQIRGLLASLSIGGLALGLAAQDTLANLFGAVAIFIDKPFRVGDRIKLDAVDGVVEAIGLRSTRVRNGDGFLITIPNKTMGNATITNVTKRPNIKTVVNLTVTYDTPVEKLRQAISTLEEVYMAHPMTADVWVNFTQFADNALILQVVHWWKSQDYKPYLDGMQELNLEVKRRFDAAGIGFAFPSRTIYLRQDSDWKLHSDPAPIEPRPTA